LLLAYQGFERGVATFYDLPGIPTDFTEDLKKFDVPTLIIHGDDDQIVPYADAGLLSSKMIKGSELKTYPGAPHGLCSTLKDKVNQDLLAFFQE